MVVDKKANFMYLPTQSGWVWWKDKEGLSQ